MRDTLTKDEISLLSMAISNPKKYSIQVDNDDIFVIDTELNEVVGDFYIYGQEMLIALFTHLGASADFV